MPKFRPTRFSPEHIPLYPSSRATGPGFRPYTCRHGEPAKAYNFLWSLAEFGSLVICDPPTFLIFLHAIIAVGYPLVEDRLILPSLLWDVLRRAIPPEYERQFVYYAERNSAPLDLTSPGTISTLETDAQMVFPP